MRGSSYIDDFTGDNSRRGRFISVQFNADAGACPFLNDDNVRGAVSSLLNLRRKPVAAPRNRFDVIASQRLALCVDVLREVCFLDKAIRPQRLHQIVFFDDVAIFFDQQQKRIDSLRFERDDLAVTQKLPVDGVDRERSELENSLVDL